jgi:hypothetical protein
MRSRSFWFATVAVCATAGFSTSASAQEIGSTASSVIGDDSEYRYDPVAVGPFTFEVGGEAQLEYNSNVFAASDNAKSDVVARIRPYAEIKHRTGALRTTLLSKLDLRRYADLSSENAEAASVLLTTEWSPREGESLYISGSVDRTVEDRGDPESRQIQGIGPRIYRILGGSAGYSRRGSRFLVEVVGDVRNVDALASIDDARDYDSYSGRVTVGYRSGGPFYFTGTGYYTRREFRLPEAITNIDRDVSTVGGLLGIRFDDGGLIEGRVGAGIFKLTADDPARDGRTGFSMQGQLTYRPRRRTAIRLNLFSGDVTSFRSGGSTRIETNIGVAVDQEIRHNLVGSAGVEWQKVKFSGGNSRRQERWRANGGLEYLVSRNLSAFGRVSYSTRSSDDPLDEYDRFQVGAGVRLRF